MNPLNSLSRIITLTGTESLLARLLLASVEAAVLAAAIGKRIAALLEAPFQDRLQLTWGSAAALALVTGLVLAFGAAGIAKENAMSPSPNTDPSGKNSGSTQASQTVVTGQVLDPSGQPAADVPVAAVICGETPWFHPAAMESFAQTRTDDQGRFRLAGRLLAEPRDVSLSVYAWQPGCAIASHEFWPASKIEDLTLRLEPEVPVAGQVLDRQGNPVEGARVDLLVAVRTGPGTAGRFLPDQYQARPQPAATDSQGRFTLHGMAVGQHAVILVDAPGYTSRLHEFQHNEAELGLSMSPRKEYEAAVVYEDGSPVPGAVVTAHSQSENFIFKAVTDAQGRFRVAPHEGWLQMAVYTPDGGIYQWEYGPRGKDVRAILEQHKVVIPGVAVRGTVVEEPGAKPVAGAVAIWDDGRSRLAPSARAITDAGGRFTLTIPPGKGAVLVTVPGSLDYIKQQVSEGQIRYGQPGGHRMAVDGISMVEVKPDRSERNVVVTLRRGVTLEGTALQPDGKPVVEGEVLLGQYMRGVVTVPRECRIRSGRFTVSGVNPQEPQKMYLLDAAAQYGAVATLSAKDPQPVRLAPCGMATVRFVDPSGKPCTQEQIDPSPMFLLDIVFASGIGPIIDDPKAPVVDSLCWANGDYKRYKDLPVDAEGRVVFPTLIPGAQYSIRNFAKPGQPIRTFAAESGRTIDLGEIVVEPGKPVGSIDSPGPAAKDEPPAP